MITCDVSKSYEKYLRRIAFLVKLQAFSLFQRFCPLSTNTYFKEQLEVAAFEDITTQQTITCSKSTIETLEQGVKYVQI